MANLCHRISAAIVLDGNWDVRFGDSHVQAGVKCDTRCIPVAVEEYAFSHARYTTL